MDQYIFDLSNPKTNMCVNFLRKLEIVELEMKKRGGGILE